MADLKSPWREHTLVGFDTETTGKYPLLAELVEIAAVKWVGGKVVDTYQTLVKPNRRIGEDVIKIHHITNEMVEKAPKVDDVLDAFGNFIDGSVLVAHRAAYDMGFIALEYDRVGKPLPHNYVLDSSLLAKMAFPKSTNHRLSTLTELLNIPLKNAHRALDDSQACLEVALQSMEKIAPRDSLEKVLEMQKQVFKWETFSVGDLLANPTTHPLIQACREQLVLEIIYKGGSHPGKPRRITPYGLVRNPQGDYVVAMCHIDNLEKRFYLQRMTSAKILD